MNASEHLRDCARRLALLLSKRDLNHDVMKESVKRIAPLIEEALGEQKNLPTCVPMFLFTATPADDIALGYPDVEMGIAIADFGKAMAAVSTPQRP